MSRTSRFVTAAAALLMIAGAASAQSRSSFQDIDAISGITYSTPDDLNFTVTVALAPTMVIGGNLYTINSVFGFWALSNDDNLTPANSNFVDGDGATWAVSNNNGGAGGIAGWSTNPNTGLTVGQSLVFTFTSLTGTYETVGFHIRTNETLPFGGNTAYFTLPTPGAAALLGLGSLVATRRRR